MGTSIRKGFAMKKTASAIQKLLKKIKKTGNELNKLLKAYDKLNLKKKPAKRHAKKKKTK
jgi:hypothetical protein